MRRFKESDAAPLTELLHAAYAELGAMGLNFTAVDQSVETTLHRALGGECWIVERDGRFVGTITMTVPPSNAIRRLTNEAHMPGRAWLNQLAVSPSERGTGIASELWRLGREWAAEHGVTSIGIDTAGPAQHLVAMYRKWGFAPVDTIHWPGKTYDSVVMVRPITGALLEAPELNRVRGTRP